MIFTPHHGRDAGEQPQLRSALQTNYREQS